MIVLLLLLIILMSVPARAAENNPSVGEPPHIAATVSKEEVKVGETFYLQIALDWQEGRGYQLAPEVTVPEGLVKGPVSASSKSFGSAAGQLLYKMEFTAREPAQYVFGDLAVRYWQAGHQDQAEYQHLPAITVKAVVPRYLGLTLPWLIGAAGGIILVLSVIILLLIRHKRNLQKPVEISPREQLENFLNEAALAVERGDWNRALTSLAAGWRLIGDQEKTATCGKLLEKYNYGGEMPQKSTVEHLLRLARLEANNEHGN